MKTVFLKGKFLEYISLENWIYLGVFLLPSYLIKVSLWGLPTNLLEIILSAVILGWFFNGEHRKSAIKKLWLGYKKQLVCIGLILLGLLISMLLNGNYRIGLGIIKGWFVFPVLFFIMALVVLDGAKVKKLFRVFYFSALTVSIIALVYWIGGQLTFDGRLQSFFNSPNYLAMYLAPAIIIGIFLIGENKKIYLLSLLPILLAIYFTKSFSAWVALVGASLAIFFLTKKKNKKRLIYFLILSLVFFGLLFSQFGTKKAEGLLEISGRSSSASRIMIWKVAQEIIYEKPLWGIGPGNFQNEYLNRQKNYPSYLEWAVPHPHNIFLAFWLYSGVFGLIGFLGLIFLFFLTFFRQQKNALNLMALGVMIYILMHGLLDTTYFKNDLAIIFWLAYLGMIKGDDPATRNP